MKNDMRKIPSELRYCYCGCGKTLSCKINSSQKYLHGHNPLVNRIEHYLPRETRVCKCGCNKSFKCIISSPKKFILGHANRGKKFIMGKYPLRGKTYEEVYGIEKANAIKKKQGDKKRKFKRHEIRICQCGCDKSFEVGQLKRQRYIHGHNMRISKHWKIGLEKILNYTRSKKGKTWEEIYGEEYREKQVSKILKGSLKRPTSYEAKIISLIKKYNLPYKYVGDGEVWIGRKNPDFLNINGEKILIEVYSAYRHPDNYEIIRTIHFSKYGFKVIFLNDNDLYRNKNWESQCLGKILS